MLHVRTPEEVLTLIQTDFSPLPEPSGSKNTIRKPFPPLTPPIYPIWCRFYPFLQQLPKEQPLSKTADVSGSRKATGLHRSVP